MTKINYGTSEIVKEYDTGIRLIKFNGRYYTCYGCLFAVAGNHVKTPYNEVCKMKHYSFTDWNTLENMFVDE